MPPFDDDTVETTYRRLFPMVASKCARMLGETAEAQDIAQETFVRLWHARDELRDPATVTAWVYRTATRLAIDRLRRRRHEAPEAEPMDHPAAHVHPLPTTGTPESLSDSRRTLQALARTLPEDELEAVILSHADGLTQPEIAEVLRVSERTVRRLLTRSEARLAKFAAAGGIS